VTYSHTLPSLTVQVSKVPVAYRGLHKYLKDRYADTVVLSFAQIEALIDGALPPLAHFREWWAMATSGEAQSVQSRAWTEADRTAKPNLSALNVMFERVAVVTTTKPRA
jgi:hypothetical protein